MRTEGGALCHLLLHRLRQFMELEIGVLGGLFGDFQALDHAPPRVGAETSRMALGILDRGREKGVKLVLRGLGIKRQHDALIAVEAIRPLDQFERVEARRAIGDLAEIHRAVAGHEILGMDEAEVDIERLDQLVDLLLNPGPPGFEFRRGGDEDRIAERHVFRDVEKLDLAILDPGLDREFPAVEMAFEERGKLVIRDRIDILDGANGAMPEAARLVEGLEMDGIVGITVQLEQCLVHPLEKTHHVGVIVGLLENADANACQLRAAFHQGFVAEQHRLSEQARIVEQDGVDRPCPFDGFLVKRDRHVAALVLEDLRDLVRALVEPVEIPGDEGDVIGPRIVFGPRGCNDYVASVKAVDGVDCVQRPAEDRHIALVWIFLSHDWPFVSLECPG